MLFHCISFKKLGQLNKDSIAVRGRPLMTSWINWYLNPLKKRHICRKSISRHSWYSFHTDISWPLFDFIHLNEIKRCNVKCFFRQQFSSPISCSSFSWKISLMNWKKGKGWTLVTVGRKTVLRAGVAIWPFKIKFFFVF